MDKVFIHILKLIDAGHFWAREAQSQEMSEEAALFEKLCDQMTAHAENDNMPAQRPTQPKSGQVYLGKRKTDGKWYRVRCKNVMQTTNGLSVSCFLLDYAQDEMIPLRGIREISEEFLELPFQAKECVLHGVRPVTMGHQYMSQKADFRAVKMRCDKWDTSALTFMKQILKDSSLPRIQMISRTADERCSVKLFLASTTRGEICVNDLLVEKEFADYSNEEAPSPILRKQTSDSDTEKPIKVKHRRRNKTMENFLNPTIDIPGLTLPSSTSTSPSQSCTGSDGDSNQGSKIRGTPRTSDTVGGGFVKRAPPGDAATSTAGPTTSRGGHVTSPPGIGRGKLLLQVSSSKDSVVGLSPEPAGPGLVRSGTSDSEPHHLPGRGQSAVTNNRMESMPVVGRGMILQNQGLSIGRGRSVLGEAVRSRSVSPQVGISSESSPVVGGRGRAMMQAIQHASREVSPISDHEGYVSSGRGRGLLNRAYSPSQSPGGPTVQSPVSSSCQSGIQPPKKLYPSESNLNNATSYSTGGASAQPTSFVPSAPVNEISTKLCSSPSAAHQSASLSSPVASKLTGRARNTAHIRSPRLPAAATRNPSVSPSLTPNVSDNEMIRPAVSMVDKALLKGESLASVRTGTGYTSSDSSAQESIVKKKNVSFSDQEEFFSIPARRPHQYDSTGSSDYGHSRHKEQTTFEPRAVTECAALREFAGASLSFSSYEPDRMAGLQSPEEYGVQVFGQWRRCFHKVRELPFTENVKRMLEVGNVKQSTSLQMYMWPVILRGCDAVGIGRHDGSRQPAGKTLSYLAPILTELKQTSSYEQLPISNGPYVIILAPSTQDVLRIDREISLYSDAFYGWRSLVIFTGTVEGSRDIELINGCEILIATPPSLLGVLTSEVTCLDRLSHLVLEYSDLLLEDFGEQIEEIMKMYQKTCDTRHVDASRQIVAVAEQWSPDIGQFIRTHMQSPTVVIASRLECTFAGDVKQLALMTMADQRLSHLLDQVREPELLTQKILVCVNTVTNADKISQMLFSYSIVALCAHEEMVDTKRDEVERQWNLPHRSDSTPVLVTTDRTLKDLDIQDASCVIHFDAPLDRHDLERRLWCMRKCWRHPFNPPDGDTVQCRSYFYMTEANTHLAGRIIKMLQRCGSEVPPQLQRQADIHQETRERESRNLLCDKLKAFGYCKHERRCRKRHHIVHNLDYPGQDPRYITVPMEGEVKIQVTHVHHASHYYARLLQLKKDDGSVVDLSAESASLPLYMATHYAQPLNRRVCEYPKENCLYAWEDTQHVFNRVEVHQLSTVRKGNQDMAWVYFVDTGRVTEVNVVELLELPEHLSKICYQAVEIYICRIKPKDQDSHWSKTVSARICEQIQNKELVGTVVLSLGHTLWMDPLVSRTHLKELKQTIIEFSVRSLLLQEEMAEENPYHMESLRSACAGRVDVPNIVDPAKSPSKAITVRGMVTTARVLEMPLDMEYVDVVISATDSPDLFFVQLHKEMDNILDIQDEIVEYVRLHDLTTPDNLQTGMLVLAQIPEQFGWYRSKVVEVKGDGLYDLFLLDFGDSIVVDDMNILPLPGRFQSRPYFAIECCLVDIDCTEAAWSEEVGDWFYDYTRLGPDTDDGKVLRAKVMTSAPAHHTGKLRYALHMYDLSSEYDVNIAHKLVLEGSAKVSSTALTNMFPKPENLEPNSPKTQVIKHCKAIVESQDIDLQKRLVSAIQQLVITRLSCPDNDAAAPPPEVCCALCQALQLVGEPSVSQLLITSYVYLVKNNNRENLEVSEYNALGALCAALDCGENLDLTRTILWAFKELISQQGYRSSLFAQGAPRIIRQVISLDKNHDMQIVTMAAEVQDVLFTKLTTKELQVVVDSKYLEAMCARLQADSPDEPVWIYLHTMEHLAHSHKQMRDHIRKAGGVKVICSRLENFTESRVREEATLVLRSMANNNRFNKDVMIEYKAFQPLQRYADDEGLSQDARNAARELSQRLHDLLPSNKSPCKKRRDPVIYDVCSNGFAGPTRTTVNGIRPMPGQDMKNRPLPEKFCSTTVPIRSNKPSVKWSQDRWNMWLSVDVKDVPHSDVATFTEDTVSFRAVVNSTEHSFQFHLFEVIQPAKCQVQVRYGSVMLGLRKKSRGHWPRVLKDKHTKLSYITRDYNRMDSSSDEEEDGGTDAEPELLPLDTSKSKVTKASPFQQSSTVKCRHAEGLPPELVMHRDSNDDDDDYDEDENFEEFVNPDPNKKYDYYVPY